MKRFHRKCTVRQFKLFYCFLLFTLYIYVATLQKSLKNGFIDTINQKLNFALGYRDLLNMYGKGMFFKPSDTTMLSWSQLQITISGLIEWNQYFLLFY